MMKISYEIGGRTLTLRATVHTWFAYKEQFGRELAEDMERAIALDGLRNKEPDEVKSSLMFGEECRLFLQLLWTFADDGTPELEPFEDWLESISGVDIVDVVRTVSELYASTMKPDRKNRGGGGGDSGSLTVEELAEMLLSCGVTLSDMRELTVGQAINLIHAHVRSVKRARGEDVPDPEEQYKRLKEAVELIESGAVEDYDVKEYERVKKKLKEYENG